MNASVPSDAEIAARIAGVRTRIDAAARRVGRDPDSVRLIAVSKAVDVARVRAGLRAGLDALGENRAQELVAKAAELGSEVPAWHFVGQLQSNKIRHIAPIVTRIHSVDRESQVGPLRDHAPHAAMLVQVSVSGDPHKGGCTPEDARRLVDRLRAVGVRGVDGLMTIPVLGHDPRPAFDELRELGSDLGLSELSMGMTDDYESAIEHGSTMVRVGRAIFGPRRPPANVEQYSR